jgi:phosphatidylinositol 4-kinase B
MQAHLKDLALSRYESESFHICQRILNQCHEMIYGDLPASGTPYSSFDLPTLPGFVRKKVKANAQPALVGMGMILAGAPGMPELTGIMGEVAIEQGRLDDKGEDVRSLDNPDGVVRTRFDSPATASEEKDDEDYSDPEESITETKYVPSAPPDGRPPLSAARLSGQSPKNGPRSRSQTIAAQTSPALPLYLKDPRKARLSEDPFGQKDHPTSSVIAAPSPFQSTPTFSASRQLRRPGSLTSAEGLLQKYDFEAQKYLLRTHFARSEVNALFYTS